MLRAIETGYVQREIQKAAYQYQQSVERKERIVVGVNRYHTERQEPVPVLRIDPAIEREQIERVRALRARRDTALADKAIAEVESRARSGANLMSSILAAVEAYATVGEISDAMRRVFGEHQETLAL
jgi:methylmalonyl-CoA mutase, N-terminal domain